MNDELLALQARVNTIIYNPFINLKDLAKEVKKLLVDTDTYSTEILKLTTAINLLDEFENMPYGNIERIKGFNKTKSTILKIIKEIDTKP